MSTSDMKISKAALLEEVSRLADTPKSVAGRVVDAFLEAVTEALVNGQQVALVGFGTFLTKDRAAREGRNPQTGETIQIAAARLPAFKAGKALKDAVKK